MANFPVLKTGAVAQYPASRTVEFSTRVLQFADGTEQRYRQYDTPLRRWVIRLSLLDGEELANVESFFQSEQGRYGSFAFTDPIDGTVYPSCSLESDRVELECRDYFRGETVIVILENRD